MSTKPKKEEKQGKQDGADHDPRGASIEEAMERAAAQAVEDARARRAAGTAEDRGRAGIVSALRLLCQAKPHERLEPALREVITELTEGSVNAALKLRLSIIAQVAHDEKIRQAVEAL